MTQANPIKTMFCAKYALTCSGVTTGQWEIVGNGFARSFPNRGWTLLKVGRDVFEARADAVSAAEAARTKKIASLKKQLAKLEKLEF